MKTYEQLGIDLRFSYDGESFYHRQGARRRRGAARERACSMQDDGAWIVDLATVRDAALRSSSSATARRCIPSRDIAAAVWRKKEYDFDKCIYVTSAGQSLHFAQWFKVVELMGYDWADRLVHVPYGTMSRWTARKARDSRTGNVVSCWTTCLPRRISKAERDHGGEEPRSLPNQARDRRRRSASGAVVFNCALGQPHQGYELCPGGRAFL